MISDVSGADDMVELDRSVFGALGRGTLGVDSFVTGTSAKDAEDRIIYDSATGRIYYDADGNGAGAQVLFAQVAAATALTSVDFLVTG
jgi:Ca2+-binding RTX toxin-like protein